MGLFDRVETPGDCPHCGHGGRLWTVQYKYGDVWCRDRKLGDYAGAPKGGDGSIPAGLIVTEGIAEGDCPICGNEVWAAVYLRDGRLWRVGLLRTRPMFEGEYEAVREGGGGL